MRPHRVLIAVTILLLTPTHSSAECFILGTLCQEFAHWAAIVDATVESSQQVPMQRERTASGTLVAVEPHSRVLVRVHRVWKGLEAPTGTLEMFSSALEGGVRMEPGRRYLLYASRDGQGRLWAYGCGRSKPVEDATMELAFLESKGQGARAATVSGMVQQTGYPLGLKDVEVVLTGASAPPRSAKTDATGRFVMSGVATGVYTIEVVEQPPLRAFSPKGGRQILDVRDSSECYEVVFVVSKATLATASTAR